VTRAADLLLRDGDAQGARKLAAAALATFIDSRTRYDVTHARVELARIARAFGQGREAAEQGARSRAEVLAMGYGLLSLMYPDTAYDLCERIAGALTAYAYGDALGLPWENKPKASSAAEIEQLPAREGWPRGSTTDDTALTLLAARHLADRDGSCDAGAFLADLATQEPAIRGIGPTTTAAIEQFRRTGKVAPSADRATNGAAMRALPVGWVLPYAQAERRRQLTSEISRATHAAPAALVAACVIATCASWVIEGADATLLLEVAIDEARDATQAIDTDPRLAEMLTEVSEGAWTAPISGISLDPYETVIAVLSCVAQASSLRDGLVSAVQLGGDTDTVAALVGGLLGCRLTPEQVRAELPWHRLVVLPELESAITGTAAALATTRTVQPE
jgi:ADP-ribosyl-[dinitrogen reductase] hydrolase